MFKRKVYAEVWNAFIMSKNLDEVDTILETGMVPEEIYSSPEWVRLMQKHSLVCTRCTRTGHSCHLTLPNGWKWQWDRETFNLNLINGDTIEYTKYYGLPKYS